MRWSAAVDMLTDRGLSVAICRESASFWPRRKPAPVALATLRKAPSPDAPVVLTTTCADIRCREAAPPWPGFARSRDPPLFSDCQLWPAIGFVLPGLFASLLRPLAQTDARAAAVLVDEL